MIKTNIIIILIFLLAFVIILKSQNVNIPNGDFEKVYEKLYYEEPIGYNTSNPRTYNTDGLSNVIKTSDSYNGNYALKIQSYISKNKTVFSGFADYKKIISKKKILDGFSFTEKPTALKGYFQYKTSDNDSTMIYFGFKKNGNIIYYKRIGFYGNLSTYKEFIFSIDSLNITPDTAFIGFASSIPSDKKGANKASGKDNYLIIDNLSFMGAKTLIPNGDFEEWTTYKSKEFESFNSLNYLAVLQNKDIYAEEISDVISKTAIKIKTNEYLINGVNKKISYITTGYIDVTNNTKKAQFPRFYGGFAINSSPDSLCFYYKYNNNFNTNDSALIIAEFKINGMLYKKFIFPLTKTDKLTYKSYRLNLKSPDLPKGSHPDTANIIISSSNYLGLETDIGIGNELILDNINFVYNPQQTQKFNISGIVSYDNDMVTVMKDVKLILKNKEGLKIDSTSSNEIGSYIFHNVDSGEYLITVSTNKSWRKASPIDALIINRAYLSMYKIKTPLQRKAGDVDGNGKIFPTDALLINRRFLGILKKYKIDDWLFEIPDIKVIDKDIIINIKAICAGDVKGSFTP